jgi:geranylgeranyl diphosphate synthase type I
MTQSSLGERAKETLRSFMNDINARLDTFWHQEIDRNFGFNDRQRKTVRELLEHAREHNMRPAKRIRGAFTFYGYLLGGGTPTDKVWDAAMGVELVHTALLMHDDFMDRDTVRRGKPTTHVWYKRRYNANEHFGISMAVNVGDVVLNLGCELVAKTGNISAIRKMLRGIAETAFGQAYDMILTKVSHWREDDVLTLHQAKTAIYTYENPLFIGAHLAGLPREVFSILRKFSNDGGIAFQLQDDILGVFGEPSETGKSTNSDLLQGKSTLLVLKVLEKGTAAQRRAIGRVWGKRKASWQALHDAKQAIIDSGSLEYNRVLARTLAERAAQTAHQLRNHRLNDAAVDFLQGVAEYMVTRNV